MQSTGNVAAVFTGFANVAISLPPLPHKGGDAAEENPLTDVLALGLQVDTGVGTLPFLRARASGGRRPFVAISRTASLTTPRGMPWPSTCSGGRAAGHRLHRRPAHRASRPGPV